MTITYYSVFLNHHQAYLADELYKLLGNDYTFVEIAPCTDGKGSQDDFSKRPYLLRAWESEENKQSAFDLSVKSDVCIYCSYESLPFEIPRIKKGLFTFEADERWLKRGLLNLLSPRLLRSQWYYHTVSYNKPVYKLCASAYCAKDLHTMHSFKAKCYKWGYFTKVEKKNEVEVPKLGASTSESTPLMWCARFLRLKHPELPVMLAARLKSKGFVFTIDMFGEGEEFENIRKLITKLNVSDCVKLCGGRPNDEILKEMRRHNIFLFTSDKNEGWGAVANEAMSNGCTIVGSDAIGSVPFLVKHRYNGCVFKSNDLNSLEEEVIWLLEHPEECIRLSKNGMETIRNLWSPENAALKLMILIDDLKNGRASSVKDGPCSVAEVR